MPPKQKADTAGYQQLKKDLAGGEPGRLYLFHGEETYLRDHYLGRLKELLLTGGMGEFNLHTIPAREMSPRRLEEAVDCLPMMAPRTLVLVRDFDLFKAGEKDREAYAKLFEELPDYVCLVFVYDLIPYKGDARTKLAAAIKQNGTVVNFARQDQGDLVDWVRRRFRALGKEIDTRLACDLIFLCGDLMTNLIGEIEKIGAYAKGGRITREDIDAVATPQLDAVVFQMTDAIAAGKEAAVSIHRFVHPGQSQLIGRDHRDYKSLDPATVAVPIESFDNTPRQHAHDGSAEEAKKTFHDLRGVFTEEQMKKETERCLGCGAVVLNEDQCIGCGICTTKCKFDAIRLEKVNDTHGREYFRPLLTVAGNTPAAIGRLVRKTRGR